MNMPDSHQLRDFFGYDIFSWPADYLEIFERYAARVRSGEIEIMDYAEFSTLDCEAPRQ